MTDSCHFKLLRFPYSVQSQIPCQVSILSPQSRKCYLTATELGYTPYEEPAHLQPSQPDSVSPVTAHSSGERSRLSPSASCRVIKTSLNSKHTQRMSIFNISSCFGFISDEQLFLREQNIFWHPPEYNASAIAQKEMVPWPQEDPS